MNEWVIIAIIAVVLLFSAKKLPDMARGLGQSMRIFKSETRGMREDEQAAGQGTSGTSGSTGAQQAGQIAPGRAAGSPTAAGNGAATPEADTAGTVDGAPRAGS